MSGACGWRRELPFVLDLQLHPVLQEPTIAKRMIPRIHVIFTDQRVNLRALTRIRQGRNVVTLPLR